MNFINRYNEKFDEGLNKDNADEILEKSIVVIDTNCLLSPFSDYIAGEQIVSTFSKISTVTDVYVPFITQVEYLENKNSVINQRKSNVKAGEKLGQRISELSTLINTDWKNQINNSLDTLKDRAKNSDENRSFYSKINEFRDQLIKEVDIIVGKTLSELDDKLVSEKNSLYNQFDWGLSDIDTVEDEMNKWIEQIHLGADYSLDEIENYLTKIKGRYKEEKSPGYKDRDKGGTIFIGGKVVNRSYSDAIFWLDILDYIKKNAEKYTEKKYLILLSNEKKSDWVLDKKHDLLNVDLFTECYRETKLFAKKMDVLSFVKTFDKEADLNIIAQSENEIEFIEENNEIEFIEENYDYTLYGPDYRHYPTNRIEMMKMIFKQVLSRVDGENYLKLSCVRKATVQRDRGGIFEESILIQDRKNVPYEIGTSVNLKQQLNYLYELLETRTWGSSGQLKFDSSCLQEKWEQVRRTRESQL